MSDQNNTAEEPTDDHAQTESESEPEPSTEIEEAVTTEEAVAAASNSADSQQSFIEALALVIDAAIDAQIANRIDTRIDDRIADSKGEAIDVDELRASITTDLREYLNSELAQFDQALRVSIEEQLDQRLAEFEPPGGSEPSPELEALIARVHLVLDRLQLAVDPAERFAAGPDEIESDDEFHSNELWGIQFQTQHPLYLGQATMQSFESGSCTITLYRFEANRLQEIVAETKVNANTRVQRIGLDMFVPPGEYLLTRPVHVSKADAHSNLANVPEIGFKASDEAVAFRRRANYDGWENDSQAGVEFLGGNHPVYSSNSYWYYFYSLDVNVNPLGTSGTQAQTEAEQVSFTAGEQPLEVTDALEDDTETAEAEVESDPDGSNP